MSIQRNNPGNIRRVQGKPWQGELVPVPFAAGFVTFSSLEYGFRALLKLLQTYITKYQADTVSEIITRWAPPAENPTASYIQFVSAAAGINPYQQIAASDLNTLSRIAAGIADFEHNGALTAGDLAALNAAAGSFTGSAPGAGSQSAGLSAWPLVFLFAALYLGNRYA